ncbi:MAG: RnfH family protein [Nitrosomonadales bacterium]|nr:RnfH family protein [Nitrosomonadales bacterium]
MGDKINIEVVYALPQEQMLFPVLVAQGCTLAEAINLSGVLKIHPEIDLPTSRFGIYGKLSRADAVLRDKDRIELYRPLIADPKEVRRQRAMEGKAMKKGGGET